MRAMILAMAVSLAVPILATPSGAAAQPAPAAGAGARKEACEGVICWEIVNRFRLFQRRADFERHARAFERVIVTPISTTPVTRSGCRWA